jgi:hypothetical protein
MIGQISRLLAHVLSVERRFAVGAGSMYEWRVTRSLVRHSERLRGSDCGAHQIANIGRTLLKWLSVRLQDIAKPEGKFFLKSVYGPFGSLWTAMSYTRPQLKTYLNRHYRPGTDFILYTGTSGKQTEEEHRGRLLSVLSVDLTRSYRTEEVVSEESWRWAQANYPGQWEFSFGVVNGWNFDPPPLSNDALPHSYPLMGQYPNPGMVLPIQPEERDHIMGLAISKVSIAERPAMKKALTLQAMLSDKALDEEAVRISELIDNRIDASGSLQTRRAPLRNAPADLILLVAEKLREQPLSCALCGGLMFLQPTNKLLQPSPDRIDSRLGSYGPENFQLAHLGCNLAKNDATVAQFQEWLHLATLHSSGTDESQSE